MSTQGDRRPRPKGRWFLLFMLAGLPAIFSAMVLPFSAALALPWVAVSWPLAGLGGYKIWRAQHPTADAWKEISRRGLGVLSGVATFIAFVLALAFPHVVLLIFGVYFSLLMLMLLVFREQT